MVNWGPLRPKLAQKRGFVGFMVPYSWLIDSKVLYSDSTHRNLSFGTKTKSLWPYGVILWGKIDQILVKKGGRRRFLVFLTTTTYLNCCICGCMLLYSLRQFFWYQNCGSRTLRWIFGGFKTSPIPNLATIAQKSPNWPLLVIKRQIDRIILC